MSRKAKMNNKGFSLVELIIVVAIMAILAGVMIPQFVKYLGNSKKSADLSQAESIANAVSSLYAEDMTKGSATAGMNYDGSTHAVDVSVVNALNMGNSQPKPKVSGTSFQYMLNPTNGEVKVYVDSTAIYPDPSGTDWAN